MIKQETDKLLVAAAEYLRMPAFRFGREAVSHGNEGYE